MSKRSAAAAATRQRIVEAMLALYFLTPYPDLRIEDVAARAGVTAQTVFRHFGTKAALMVAAAGVGSAAIDEIQKPAAADGTLDEFIGALIATQEYFGDALAKLWAEVHLVEGLPELAAEGRAKYLAWLQRGIEGHLPLGLDGAARAVRIAQVIAVCDTATWKLLREDGRLDQHEALAAYTDLIRRLVSQA